MLLKQKLQMSCIMLKQIIVTAVPQTQSLLYKEMFTVSLIASSTSKMAYIVKYCLAEYFKEQVQLDLQGVPYNGLVVKALNFQSRGPVFKTTGWSQGWLSLSSFQGR